MLQSVKIACQLAGLGFVLSFSSWVIADTTVVAVSGSTSSLAAVDMGWSIRLPEAEKVVYQGVVSFDEAGTGTGSVLYPAAGAAGFLVALVTHGLINESVKNSQKNQIQDAANQVLLPYQAILGSYTHEELMCNALGKAAAGGRMKLVAFSEKPGADGFIESTPVFSMTQDQTAIILDNVVAVYTPGSPTTAAYKNVIRIVSQAQRDEDISSFWMANQGEKLKEESARLFAESLDLALGEVTGGPGENTAAHKTVRYREGNTEKMERGQPVSQQCNRVVIKTLRGWLMSIPVAQQASADTAAAESCGDTPQL